MVLALMLAAGCGNALRRCFWLFKTCGCGGCTLKRMFGGWCNASDQLAVFLCGSDCVS